MKPLHPPTGRRTGFFIPALLLTAALLVPLSPAGAQPQTLLVKMAAPLPAAARDEAGALRKQSTGPLSALAARPEVALINPLFPPADRITAGASIPPERIELGKWLILTLATTAGTDALAEELQRLPEVIWAGAPRCFHLDYTPDDPLFSRQYGLRKISAPAGWESGRGSSEIVIGVIDTGIDYDHPDLKENLWVNAGEDLNGDGLADSLDLNGVDDDGNGFIDDVQGYDFTDAPNYPDGGDYRGRDADPMDEMGHGTAVGGIIAAVAGNGLGIAGTAPGCRVMNLRAFTAGGNGEEDDVAAAILYAIENGAAVINMSWGDVFVSRLLDDVLHYASALNTVLVASAGNSATDQIHYPSAFANTISVGATDASDQLAGFSNYGPSIDIVAPGVNILTTARGAQYDSSLSGTSFSAPFVSAAAALLLSQQRERSPDGVRSLLTTSAQDLGPQGWDIYYGAGRLDLARALAPGLAAEVRITSPWLDQGFQESPIEIVGSAWTPSLQSYTLEWGMGDNPAAWLPITPPSSSRVIDGLLGSWEELPAADTSYTIRLRIQNSNGSVEQSQVRIFIDRTAPVISNIELIPMYDAGNPSCLLQFETDDLCEGEILFRPAGGAAPWQEAPMSYRSYQPRLHLTRDLGAQVLDVRISVDNPAGLRTVSDSLLRVDLSPPPLNTMRYTRLEESLPHGHLLDRSADFNGDGRPEIVIGAADSQGRLFTTLFSRDGSGFRQLYTLPESAIPRSSGDSDGDGVPELLAGYGFTTWLYEAGGSDPFRMNLVRRWQGDSRVQYWGSRLADLDGDNRSELIMRVVRTGETSSDLFEVWRSTGGGEFETMAALPNPTAGDNFNGVPRCETGDFDGDGRPELLFGDSDGDLYIYEYDGSAFSLTWQERLPLFDAIDYIAAGDFDGDGEQEFAAGSHSDPNLNTEHSYDSRHWCYRIYEDTGNNAFAPAAEWRFFGYESTRDFESGVSCADADGDGRAELFIAAFPDLYIAEYSPESGYELTFHAAPIRTNAVAVVDSDGDALMEFWASDGEAVRPRVLAGSLTGPAMPVGVTARPLNAATVALAWHPVPGAQHYLLYRGPAADSLMLYQEILLPSFTDSLVRAGARYFYAVASRDTTRTPAVSLRSEVVSALPGEPPALLSAVMSGASSLRLRFTRPMNTGLLQDVRHYAITPEIGRPATALPLASGAEVLLSLEAPFAGSGFYSVEIRGLEDSGGIPIDTLRSRAEFEVTFSAGAPYLTSVRALANGVVELEFSEPMQKASLEEIANYDPGPGLHVAWAQAVAPDYRFVRLHLTGGVAWGAVGKPLTLKVSGLQSAGGVAMKPGRGDTIQLLFAARNLDDVHTFPNPYRLWIDPDGITFANLTPEAEIRIMTTEGRTLRILYEENGDGGLVWDVRDDQGRLVPAGVYLYRIAAAGMVRLGKLAVVR